MARRITPLVQRLLFLNGPISSVVVSLYNRFRRIRLGLADDAFDRLYGVATVGDIGGSWLSRDAKISSEITAYVPVSASVLRTALSMLPIGTGSALVDLGSGKGRALILASEFNFSSITGIEISRYLVDLSRKNIALVRRRFPDRTPITVVEGDARTPTLSGLQSPIFVLLYHSFRRDSVAELIRHLSASVSDLYVVYINPVYYAAFDSSDCFHRVAFLDLPRDEPSGTSGSDLVVVWANHRAKHDFFQGGLPLASPIITLREGWLVGVGNALRQ